MNKKIDDNYWMNITRQVAKASTCRVEVGCVLVHKNIIVGVGYVGSISGDDHCCDVSCIMVDNYGLKGSSNSDQSCIRTIHAETNAILKCSVRGSKDNGWIECYSTYSPCLDCTKLLLQIGVRKFVFEKDYRDINRDKYLSRITCNSNRWSNMHHHIWRQYEH